MKLANLRVPLEIELTADTEKRVIHGVAYTEGAEFEHEGIRFRLSADCVKPWRNHMPALAYHDDSKPVGKTSWGAWSDGKQPVDLKIVNTSFGTETLTLAAEDVFGGLSMQLSDVEAVDDNGVYVITSARCREVSLVSTPRLAEAAITGVALSANPNHERTAEMEPDEIVTPLAEVIPEPVTLSAPPVHAIPLVGKRVDAPYPHLMNLSAKPSHSLFADMKASREGDQQARSRIGQHFAIKLAVTSDFYPAADPPQTPGLFENTYDDPEQMLGWVRRGPSILNDNPFYAMRWYDSSDEHGPGGSGDHQWFHDHVEGVEPGLSDIGTFGRELVTPASDSAKIALTREAVENDQTPDAEALVVRRANVYWRRFMETKVMTYLDTLSDIVEHHLAAPGVGTLGTLNALHDLATDMAYSVEGNIFDRLLVTKPLFNNITKATDTTGRRLVNIDGQAVNSQGTASPQRATFTVDGLTGTPFTSPSGNSYMLDSNAITLYLGPVRSFRFDYEVSWVRLGWWNRYAVFATDRRGIVRLIKD